MMPITIEFNVKAGDKFLKEDSVTFSTVEELFEYVAPGGDCEKMPSDLSEIQMNFLSAEHPNTRNPIADKRATLQLGIVLITAPLATIVLVAQELIDKMGRAELCDAFQAVIGAKGL